MKIGDQILLFDKADVQLCAFTVTRVEPSFLSGTFLPTENFDAVRPLFERYASMVDGNSFAHTDEVVNQIEEFGIYGKAEGDRIDLFDIQIYGEHGSLRLQPFRPVKEAAEPANPTNPRNAGG